MVDSFLVARLITKDIWGFLILATSTISIFLIILYFTPPGLELSLNYYLPRYIVLKQKNKLKSFIKNAVFLKLIFIIPYFLISILIYIIFSDLFSITLRGYTGLLLILSPLIIIDGLDLIFKAIIQSFNMFKTVFYLVLLRGIINGGALLFYFFYQKDINVYTIASITVIAHLIPTLLLTVIILIKTINIKKTDEPAVLFKESLKQSLKYGTPVSFALILDEVWNEVQIQGIGLFSTPKMITGYKIAQSYSLISYTASTSFQAPLVVSFSSLNAKKFDDQIFETYNEVFRYSLFLMLFFTGALYFFSEFFLSIIYGESYLIYSTIVKLMLICTVFRTLAPLFESLIYATNKVKYFPLIRIIFLLILLPPFFIGLIFYNLIGAIFGLLIGLIFVFILQVFLSYKIGKVKLNIKTILTQYFIFFVSLGIASVFEILFLKELWYSTLLALNLTFFNHVEFFGIFLFILINLFLNFIFKIFSSTDIDYLKGMFNKENKIHQMIRNFLDKIKKYFKD